MHKTILITLPLFTFATTAIAAEAPATSPAADPAEIIVTGDAFSETDGFLARQSSIGSRFPVDVEKLPNTVRILPQELITDTAATLPQDVTKFVSGVQVLPGFGTNVGFVIRGFFANYETLQNGVRISDNPGDLSNVERIEILKGPIGSLYGGTGAFAGNVNIITKRPRDKFGAEFTLFGGSNDFYRFEADVGGPINAAGTLKYRLTGAAESAGSFRDGVDSDKIIVSPSLAWDPSDRVSIRVDASYMKRNYIFDDGLPILDGTLPAGITTFDLPLSQTFFAPDRSPTSEEYLFAGGEGNFKLTDALTLRVAGNYSNYDIRIGSSRLGVSVQPDGQTFDRFIFQGPQQIARHTIQGDLIWKTRGIGVETVFLLGYERYQNRYDYDASGRALPAYDILSGVNPPGGAGPLAPQFAGFVAYKGDAVYGQVFSQITDSFAVLAGLRHDWQTNDSRFNGSGSAIEDSQFSPRVGATWAITDTTIAFGNWAQSFSPNFAFDRDGDVFPPDQVRQFEFGLRQKLFGDRALLTIAAFDIRRSNVVIPDITAFAQSIAGGSQTSKGLEFDLTGRIVPGLDVITTYSFNVTNVAEPDDPNFGQQLPAAPRHSASAFLRYTLQSGPLTGFGGNIGLTYASRIQATLPSTIFIPADARLDLGLAYARDGWRAGLNVTNVTNSRSYVTNFFSLFPQPPRQFVFTLTKRYGASL